MCRTQRVLAVLVLHIAMAHSFSWDIVVVRSNKLEFYNEGTLAYTAAPASHRIKWIIYDPVRDRVLFADRRNSKMSAATFDIATKITQPLITKKANRYFKRFAYDPATELLFGTRVNKIYSFSILSENKNKDGDLVIDLESTEPRELAVDSCGGYIYWTASNTIERALFNGSDRKVIIDKGLTVKQGLTIDTQKIYWIESQEYNEGGFSIESADLNGKNRRTLYSEAESDLSPVKLIVSKHFVSWRDSIETAFVWQFPKNPMNDTNIKPNKISITSTSCSSYGSQDIAANYKIEERTQGVLNCHALTILLPGYSECLHAAADGLFCVNGTRVSGESRCECTQGYIGERCDVSVCHNYCHQGDCDVAAEGQPTCRCNAGYSGERCEVDACHNHCYNNGACSLNEEDEPFCQCTAGYEGERCDVSVCKDYCWQGNCSVNAVGLPKCRCDAGYTGERCEVSLCHDYCLNNGTCSLLNNHSEPVCNCIGPYEGERCDVPICKDYCFQGECTVSAEGHPKCRCDAGYSGERCEVSPCHDYCLNNGTCFLTNHNEPVCNCTGPYEGERCDVPICKDYCFQGECTVSDEGQPKCRCDAGYSGERCEVSPCHDYCLNNGTCSLSNHSEPVCNCTGPYEGERCDVPICKDYCFRGECSVSDDGQPKCRCNAGYTGERCHVQICENYCFQGECTVSAEGQPKCRCNAGYSGERCEVSLCQDYCLNNGICSMNKYSAPVCQCTGQYKGERCDVPICKDYCFQGECTVSAEGQPKCRCNARYSGKRCEVSPCHDYCLNNGICSINKYSAPVCQCNGRYKGERCEVSPFSSKFHWLRMVNGELPPNAIIGGYEKEFTYIARAYHTTGSLCPGKYVPSHGNGYISWGGKEYSVSKDRIEILCGNNAKWFKADPRNLPKNAFIGGRAGGTDETNGEPLYIGRDLIGDALVVGKIYTRHSSCYLPYDGGEKIKKSCEILVESDD